MDVKNLNEVTPFTTKDGSEIRELLAHRNSAIRKQSLAEARLPAGGSTQEHYHVKTEEIYYITHGTDASGLMAKCARSTWAMPSLFCPAKSTSSGTRARRRCGCCAAARQRMRTRIR